MRVRGAHGRPCSASPGLASVIDAAAGDVVHAARALRRSPGFTAVAVVSLALGIGAATTVLGWLQGMVWRPLPGVARQDEIAVLVSNSGDEVSLPDLRDFGALHDAFAGVAASQMTPASVQIERRREWAYGQIVTASFFDVLEVKPILGRTFRPDEDSKPGGNPVLVVSETFWRRRLGSDPAAIGSVIDVNRHPFTLVGVVPAAFRGTIAGLRHEFWAPVSMIDAVANRSALQLTARGNRSFQSVVRLRRGTTLAQARAATATVDTRLAASFPETNREARHDVLAYRDCPWGAQSLMGPVLRLLLAVSLGVLLIVAANVANLQLGRLASRQREIAVRIAAGASRIRVFRQICAESLLVALLGGTLGVGATIWVSSLLRWFLPQSGIMPNLVLSYQLDGGTIGLAVLLTLLTGLLLGVASAIKASSPDLQGILKCGRGSGAGASRRSVRHALVVSEVALAVVLLVSALLCIKGLRKARQVDVGLDPRGVLIAELRIGMNGHSEATGKAFYRRLQQRLAALPGVEEAALASSFPLGVTGGSSTTVSAEGDERAGDAGVKSSYARISPRYFAALRIPLVAGRDFDDRDEAASPPVAIVNEHFARRFWPNQDPLGRRFRVRGVWRTVVGVAKAGKYRRVNERPRRFFYMPCQQGVPELDMDVAVRTCGEPASLAAAVLNAVHDVDAGVDVVQIKTLEDHTAAAFFAQRLAASLLTLLGGLGVLLAAMGVYAVTAFAVTQRTQEFGVRAALGADAASLLRLVVGNGLLLAALGCAAGLALAAAVTRLLAGFLFGVSPFDPLTFVAVPLFLALVTIVACSVPARRAARVDPMVALRCE